MTEPCKYEADIAVLKELVPRIEERLLARIAKNEETVTAHQDEVTKSIKELTRTLNTTLPVLKVSLKRVWWFVGIIGLIIIGSVVKSIVS